MRCLPTEKPLRERFILCGARRMASMGLVFVVGVGDRRGLGVSTCLTVAGVGVGVSLSRGVSMLPSATFLRLVLVSFSALPSKRRRTPSSVFHTSRNWFLSLARKPNTKPRRYRQLTSFIMLLRRLLDPEETTRRRRLRAHIVRRNRIHRERDQGLEPKLRRLAKPKERTINDYGWDPVRDDHIQRENGMYVAREKLQTPPVMQGVEKVAPRFGRDPPRGGTGIVDDPKAPDTKKRATNQVDSSSDTPNTRPLPFSPPKESSVAPRTPQNERVRQRWRDMLQTLLIQRHTEILSKDPNRKWRQERLGLLLFQRQQYEKASEHLTQAIVLNRNTGVSPSSLCWRRLAECHMHLYEETQDWDVLWDARAAYEQAVSHVEMACNPYVLFDYARVLEALGSYIGALGTYASILTTFPRFAKLRDVQWHFVLLQRHRLMATQDDLTPDEKKRTLLKSIEITKKLLLDKSLASSNDPRYPIVLYVHIRLHELLLNLRVETEGIAVGIQLRQVADTAMEELFKVVAQMNIMELHPKMPPKIWWTKSETYMQFADHFQSEDSSIAASDALSRALELMKGGKAATSTVDPKQKITLYLVMARNDYASNQMEKAIRAMETIFEIDPFLPEVRQSLSDWFPAKWKDRLELEEASQIQIARVLRGLWGRAIGTRKRLERDRMLESNYRTQPYHPLHRRQVLRALRDKYAPIFAAQDLAARRIQRSARKYLSYARIRWSLQSQRDKTVHDLRSKYLTRKYRYNRAVRFQLAQSLPDEFEARFRREDRAAGLVQRWFRGERVRIKYRYIRKAYRTQLALENDAATRIQLTYHRYQQRFQALEAVKTGELLFVAQQRLQQAREHLACQLQRLYRQWKNRLVVLTRVELRRIHQQRQEIIQNTSARRIQHAWRRFEARQRGDWDDSRLLIDQLMRGHEHRVAQGEASPPPLTTDTAAVKIQALYRGNRIRSSLANVNRVLAPPSSSRVATLLAQIEENHTNGREKRAIVAQLQTIAEKRALFDFPVVVIRPPHQCDTLPLDHVISAVQHSSLLRCLVLAEGRFPSHSLASALHVLQSSKTVRALVIGAISTHKSHRGQRTSLSRTPEIEDDDDDNSYDDEGSDSESDSDEDQFKMPSASRLAPTSSQSTPTSPMSALSAALRTRNFLLEELYLEGNDLLRRLRDGLILMDLLGDYFYGRYGRLKTLVAGSMQIKDEVLTRLGLVLSINTVLQHLDLHGNGARDAAAISIAQDGLRFNSSLVYLSLADNSIGSAGARALFSCLETTNRTLKTLILSNNLVMSDAVQALFLALEKNPVIELVDLRGNLLYDHYLDMLDKGFRERTVTADEDLRLFLARRRFSDLHKHRNSRVRSLSPVGSPFRRSGSQKRRSMPLSPHKWIKRQQPQTSSLVSIIHSPCTVFKTPKLVMDPVQGILPVSKQAVPIDSLLPSPSPTKPWQNATKSLSKSNHKTSLATKLPILSTASPTRSPQTRL